MSAFSQAQSITENRDKIQYSENQKSMGHNGCTMKDWFNSGKHDNYNMSTWILNHKGLPLSKGKYKGKLDGAAKKMR